MESTLLFMKLSCFRRIFLSSSGEVKGEVKKQQTPPPPPPTKHTHTHTRVSTGAVEMIEK